jgi:hypothetical protein
MRVLPTPARTMGRPQRFANGMHESVGESRNSHKERAVKGPTGVYLISGGQGGIRWFYRH